MATSPSPSSETNRRPTPNLDEPRPLSYISSHMTDIASEDGDDLRPHTGISSQPTWSHVMQSGRGPPLARNSLVAPSSQSTSRPPSAGSRMSRTHIPSLTAHGFFRPLSSQRLQAQRSGRPSLSSYAMSSEDGQSDATSQARKSVISNNAVRLGAILQDNEIPPPSRGTEFTDPMMLDRGTSNASPTGNTTVRSLGESVRLLQDRAQKATPSHLDTMKNYKPSGLQEPPQKSPMSLRSGFLMPSKNEPQGQRDARGHERLSSATSSPKPSPIKAAEPARKPNLGRNYEYFTGNTVFCGGGRFQNSRDRPVNIATGIFIVLPGALFFAYS